MQTIFETRVAHMISQKSSKEYAQSKSRLSFYLIFFTGILLGAFALFVVPSENISLSIPYIEKHLILICSQNISVSTCFIEALKLSEIDLSNIFFIFISGFTYFCFAASGTIIFAKGFMLGFSTAFLAKTLEELTCVNSTYFLITFATLKLTVCIITVLLAAETYIFSFDFRSIKQNLSVLRRAPVTYRFIFSFIRTIGASLLINFVYCLIIKLL